MKTQNKPYAVAQALLARREYGCVELQKKLEEKGFNEEEIHDALTRLTESGLQSDERYIESYLNSRKKRGFGPNHIRHALVEKGISVDLADVKIREQHWFEVAKKVWLKKYNQFSLDIKIQSKQKQFLYYRGFDNETIRQLFSELGSNSEYVDNEKR